MHSRQDGMLGRKFPAEDQTPNYGNQNTAEPMRRMNRFLTKSKRCRDRGTDCPALGYRS